MAPAPGVPSGSGTGTAEASLFRYESSDPNYAIDLAVSETGAVECPGCGEQRKQLVPHLKKDKSCMRKCEEINLVSFDKQLKAFRQRKSVKTFKSKQKEEDKEGFLENQRKQQQKTKQKRRLIPFISHSTHHCVVLFKILLSITRSSRLLRIGDDLVIRNYYLSFQTSENTKRMKDFKYL